LINERLTRLNQEQGRLEVEHDNRQQQLRKDFDNDHAAKRLRVAEARAATKSAAPLSASNAKRAISELASFPDGYILTGLDPGQRNVCGVRRKRTANDPVNTIYDWEYSYRAWRHDTGQKQRQIETNKSLAHARLNADGSRSDFAIAEAAYNAANVKTTVAADHLQALQTQARHFPAMYGFWGHPKRARVKFANLIGQQKVLRALVNRISPPATRALDVVVYGDAVNKRSAMKNSVSPKLVRALKRAGVRCVECDEYRTSMLDAVQHIVMYHPPKKVTSRNVNGQEVDRSDDNYCVFQASMPGYTRTCSRDANAAQNIMEKFEYMLANEGRVPDAFVRDSPLPLRGGTVRRYRYRLHTNPHCSNFVRTLIDE
jgi:hypothetical protein